MQARLWAYSRMITLDMILEAKKCGCRNRYEIAGLFGVTEEFLQNALDRYQAIYGIAHQIDNYLICFNPLDIYMKSNCPDEVLNDYIESGYTIEQLARITGYYQKLFELRLKA